MVSTFPGFHATTSSQITPMTSVLKPETNPKLQTFQHRTTMVTSPSWFKLFRIRKSVKRSPRDIIVVYDNTTPDSQQHQAISTKEEEDEEEETANLLVSTTQLHASSTLQHRVLTKEDIAATKIQSLFRAHLARRAFRALRSLVKLQALVRGARVRNQSRIALHCMHALVRLQVSVRARQLLSEAGGNRLTMSS